MNHGTIVLRGEPIDVALKHLDKQVHRSGLLQSLALHESFIPRPERRRRKSKAARKRLATS